ncbi:unnamed protein product, partial [Ascophyllum nodosum]
MAEVARRAVPRKKSFLYTRSGDKGTSQTKIVPVRAPCRFTIKLVEIQACRRRSQACRRRSPPAEAPTAKNT